MYGRWFVFCTAAKTSVWQLHTSKFGFLGENSDNSGTLQPRLRMQGCTCLAMRRSNSSACNNKTVTQPKLSECFVGLTMLPYLSTAAFLESLEVPDLQRI